MFSSTHRSPDPQKPALRTEFQIVSPAAIGHLTEFSLLGAQITQPGAPPLIQSL